MELLSKILERTAFNTRPKVEEHVLNIIDKPTHEEHKFQLLHTHNKQYKLFLIVTFLDVTNGSFFITSKNDEILFTKSSRDNNLNVIITPPGSYDLKSLNDEIKGTFINKGYFCEKTYPFLIKPNFSISGSLIEISSNITVCQIALSLSLPMMIQETY